MSTDLILANDLPELFRIPAAIDWSRGRNRAIGVTPQTEANDDLAAINAWLITHKFSKQTFSSYRKEAIRLFLWAAHERGKSISDLSHEDMVAYQKFIKDPQPASKWVSRSRKLPISNPNWRPFYGQLSPASQRQAVIILNTMFAWLVDAKYLAGNPLALSRGLHKQTAGNKRLTRSLQPDHIDMVLSVIDRMPVDTDVALKARARRRWAVALLYLTGLRITEAVSNTMGGFRQVAGPAGSRQWWLDVTGKGLREDEIPVTPDLLRELVAYREAFGLHGMPKRGESTPLVFSLGASRLKITRQTLHKTLKDTFKLAAKKLAEEGLDDDAIQIKEASAHWLRHSLGSNLVRQGMNIAQVRDVMRHANLATTNIYVHTDAEERHGVMVDKHKLPTGDA